MAIKKKPKVIKSQQFLNNCHPPDSLPWHSQAHHQPITKNMISLLFCFPVTIQHVCKIHTLRHLFATIHPPLSAPEYHQRRGAFVLYESCTELNGWGGGGGEKAHLMRMLSARWCWCWSSGGGEDFPCVISGVVKSDRKRGSCPEQDVKGHLNKYKVIKQHAQGRIEWIDGFRTRSLRGERGERRGQVNLNFNFDTKLTKHFPDSFW